MRQATSSGETLYYLLGDHLGSTSITANSSGNKLAELRYKAWGETRYIYGTTPKKRQYTGQVNETGIGLYYYGARWYDAALGRWAQPDAIVPVESQGIQAWDRYAFVNNNPLRYNDPTGHAQACADGDEGGGCGSSSPKALQMIGSVDVQEAIRDYLRNHPKYEPELDPAMKDDRLFYSFVATAKFQVEAENLSQVGVDFGDWTLQIGLSGMVFIPAGVRGDISFGIDGEMNLGIFGGIGGGGSAGVGGTAGPFITITNASSLDKLIGKSVQVGGQGGEGTIISYERIFFKDDRGNRYAGHSVSGRGGFIPTAFEIHTTAEQTWLLLAINQWR